MEVSVSVGCDKPDGYSPLCVGTDPQRYEGEAGHGVEDSVSLAGCDLQVGFGRQSQAIEV